jgi:hypothetical protein
MKAVIACVLGTVVGGFAGLMLSIFGWLTYAQLAIDPGTSAADHVWMMMSLTVPAGALLGATVGGLLFWHWWRKVTTGA